MPKTLASALPLILALLCALPSIAQSPRTKYNFNPGWLVMVGDPAGADAAAFDDSAWKHVSTPYAWNEDAAFRVSIHDLPVGVAWYRKHFRLPAGSGNKKIFLEFEGVRQAGDFYLNGKFIGRHEDGVMAFGFDISDDAKPAPAENVLAVRTDNHWDYKEKATGATYHWNNTNFYANYGGISKSVWLHVAGRVYQTLPLFRNLGTTGTYVYATDFDLAKHAAKITAESEVKNDSAKPQTIAYNVRVVDMQRKTIATFSGESATLQPGATRVLHASSNVSGLHFWSWGYGYLYNVATTLSIDGKVVDSVATRTGFRQTAFERGMVALNGRVIEMHGYAQRTTNEWPAVGLSVPAWMSDLSNRMMVDGNGNLVRWMHVVPWKQDVESSDRVGLIESMPAGDAEGDSKGRQWEQRVELMRDAIVYNRNNPSILFYECGNKTISDEHMAAMKAVRDQYDPHGGRAIGAREMLASHVAEYGGEMLYVDKSAYKPLWAHEYSRDEGSRKFWDNDTPPFHKDSPDYNRNQDSHAIEDVRRWHDFYAARPGSGRRVESGGVNIIFSDSNTHFRGDNNYRRSGEVDAMRIPKDGYYANQAMWDGWVDADAPRIHILGHWNYAAGTVKPIYVVSSAQKVELRLNGKPLGYGAQSTRFLYTFDKIAYAPGTLEAIGYDAAGRQVAATELKTAGAPVALKLTPRTGPGGLRADGADMALVDVEVVDANGNRCPTALNTIAFEVSGPAEFRGGIAQGPDNYILSKTLPVEGGVNRVILRSTQTAGAITVRASSDGLRPAKLHLASRPVNIVGGLSTEIPQDALPSNLKRGPTPDGPSYRDWRTSIQVASETAGANAADASKTRDDNETTAWSNDGQLATAWIEYTLAKPEMVGEIDLKLNAFRQRRYPLRVTVDGETVWEGSTPTSLGYCTLTLRPAMGQRVRIAMTGPPTSVAQDSGTKEITGKFDNAGVAPPDASGKATLSIIEADIYNPVAQRP